MYLDKNADVGVSWRKAGPFERFSEAILKLDQVSLLVVNDFIASLVHFGVQTFRCRKLGMLESLKTCIYSM